MRNFKKIGVIGILMVLIIGVVITLTGAEARSTKTYSIKTPKGMEHERLSNVGDSYIYEDEDEYSNSYGLIIVAVEISNQDELKDIIDKDLYDKYKNIEDLEDYEEYLNELVEREEFKKILGKTTDISDTKFVRIGKKNYRALRIDGETNTDNEDVIVDDDFMSENYLVFSDNYMYFIALIGKPAKIKKLQKYLNTFEIKDTFSVKGVVGMDRTLVTILIYVGAIIFIAIVIGVIVLIMKKRKSKDLNSANPIS